MRIRMLAIGLILALTRLRVPAQIVPITVTNGLSINFSGGAWGIPGDIFAAVFPGNGSINLTAEDGVTGPADFLSMTLRGYTNATNLYIAFDDAFNGTLVLIDHNPSLTTSGRKGTFSNAIGTGLYHDIKSVSIGYEFDCIDNFQCYTGSGTPIPLQFLAKFTTTGGNITVTFLT